MKTIRKSYLIAATLEKVWQALVNPKQIVQWGAGPVKMDDRVGSKFSLWGGDIYGTNKKVIKGKQLVQDWYGGDWKQPSKLTITLKRKKEGTKVDLLHKDLPDDEAAGFSDGWDAYYFGPIKELLEN